MAQPARFVGIDVGKFEFSVFCSPEEDSFTLPNTATGHRALVERLGSIENLTVALEPTGGCEWALWQALDTTGFDVRQVSSSHVRSFARSLGRLAKTDPLDARMIARFIAFRPDAGRRLPQDIVRKLNVLTTKRKQLVEMKKRLTCQMKQRGSQDLADMDDDLMALIKRQIADMEKRIEALLETDAGLRQRAQTLRSIPGVGPVLTAALIGQMPELGLLDDKQVAALVGVAPINQDSGKYSGRRYIKGGRTWLRHLLYQAALVASKHNPVLKVFAARLKESGKPHKLVIIAVARKLIVIANAMVAKNQMWKAV